MAKITKTEEQLTKDLEATMKKLYKTLPGTQEEKIQILRTKFESKIQQLIQPNQTEKVSEKKEKSEPLEEMKAILDLLRQLRPHAEIVQKYGRTLSAISQTAKKNGIYSPKAVRQLLKTPEASEMTNKDLAEKTGAYPDAIERIRQELEKGKQERERKRQEEKAKKQSKKREKPEPSEEMKAIIDLLRQLKSQTEIAEQYGKSQPAIISRIAKKNGIYSLRAVRRELGQESSKELSNEELAIKMGVYPEAIERIRKELDQKEQAKVERQAQKKEKPEPSEEMKAIIDLLRQLKPHAEIAGQYGKTRSYISLIARNNGISSLKAVKQLLKVPEAAKMTNQDLAEKTGAYPDAIERIRKEIEQEKKRTEEPKVNREEQGENVTVKSTTKTAQTSRTLKRIDTTEFFEMAKQAIDVKIMAERLGASRGKVRLYLSQYGFWERSQVVKVLEKKSDKEIANKSKISIEAIKRIREQEQAKAERRSSESMQNNRLAIQRREAELRKKEQKSFFQKAEKYASIQKWEDRTGVSKYRIVVDLRRLRNANIATQHQLKLLREWEEENIARVPPQRRMANLETEWVEYQRKVRNINGYGTKTDKSMVHFNIEKLLALYEDLLTQEQYAYLCYGYIKTEKELQALKLGKEKLGLKEETLLALREKMKEIQEINRTNAEGPSSGAGGER